MTHEDDWVLKLAIPLVIFLGILYLLAPSDTATTGFVVYDTDYVSYDPFDSAQVSAFKTLIDERLRDYDSFFITGSHYTFACARADGKIEIQTFNSNIHSVQEIADEAKNICVGRIYWRGGKQ